MVKSYNITYLEDAMSAIGAMFDYSVNTCGEDLVSFYGRFISSGIAHQVFCANPRIIAGCSGVELAEKVALLTGKPLPREDTFIDIGSPEYWTGWTLTYLSWYLNMDFRIMNEYGVSVTAVYDRYSSLHEADLSKSISFAQKQIASAASVSNPLKRARNIAGMTQRELASASGVSLRSIRAYEQGQLSLRKAESESVFNLCRVLGCVPENLI